MTTPSVVTLHSVSRIYGHAQTRVVALDKVSVDFYQGEFTAIVGPSGSGKSTLLHVLAGLDTASAGTVTVDGVNLNNLNDNALTELRRDRIGFVFQSFNLVPTLDARANIELPVRLASRHVDSDWFDGIVKVLGIDDRLTHRPHELSGGQQQRVAVARALMSRPAVLVADEPTGNLDSVSSKEVLSLLRASVDELGQTVIMVTHDLGCAQAADRVLVTRDGRIVGDMRHPDEAALREALR